MSLLLTEGKWKEWHEFLLPVSAINIVKNTVKIMKTYVLTVMQILV